MAIIRGTTPEQIFNTNIDLSAAEVVIITYKQGVNIVIEKQKDELSFDKNQVKFRLTQEESLKLKETLPVKCQIRARFADGVAVACEIITLSAGEILRGGVI